MPRSLRAESQHRTTSKSISNGWRLRPAASTRSICTGRSTSGVRDSRGTSRLGRAVSATKRLLRLRRVPADRAPARHPVASGPSTTSNRTRVAIAGTGMVTDSWPAKCDIVVCHSRAEVEIVRRTLRPRGRVIFMPMGASGVAYPPPRPAADVIQGLALDVRLPVVSCIGRLREYKGLDLACAIAEHLAGRSQTVIGGLPHRGFDVSFLTRGGGVHPRPTPHRAHVDGCRSGGHHWRQ